MEAPCRAIITAVLSLGLCASSTALADVAPSASAKAEGTLDVATVLRQTRELERAPASADAGQKRMVLARWLQDTKDYEVLVCEILPLPQAENGAPSPIGAELIVQMMLGNAAYQIEHGTGTDEFPRQVAGVQSLLRAYSAYLANNPALRLSALDRLVEIQKAGDLEGALKPAYEASCAKGKETPFLGGYLRESHVVYPLGIGAWKMVGERRYDEPEAGASVRYQRDGDTSGWIDVFFYPVGAISAEQVAQVAASERAGLLESWAKELGGKPITPLSTFTMPLAKGEVSATQSPRPANVTAHAVDFTYTRKDITYGSAMVFLVDRLYAIKFRYSADASAIPRKQVRRDLEAFSRQLVAGLDISSTGACGQPAMFDNGKRADGCVGVDAIQPVVNEGWRELRFEYGSR
jgi:hypothetical protein